MGLRKRVLEILQDRNLEALEREKKLQQFLGLDHQLIERGVSSPNPEVYCGLEELALSTPFDDYYSILKDIEANSTLVDLGAGHSKGSILSKALGQDNVLSLEVEKSRVFEVKKIAQRLGVNAEGIEVFDLLSEDIPLAQNYFIYLPLGALIFKPIEFLLKENHCAYFYVMESHGDVLDFFNACTNWFYLVKVLPSQTSRHKTGIYKYRFNPREITRPQENSFDLIYEIIQNYSKNLTYKLIKESGECLIQSSLLLPLMYNGKMTLECKEVMRIIDFENVQLFRA